MRHRTAGAPAHLHAILPALSRSARNTNAFSCTDFAVPAAHSRSARVTPINEYRTLAFSASTSKQLAQITRHLLSTTVFARTDLVGSILRRLWTGRPEYANSVSPVVGAGVVGSYCGFPDDGFWGKTSAAGRQSSNPTRQSKSSGRRWPSSINLASSRSLSGPCGWPSRDKNHSTREAVFGCYTYAKRSASSATFF